MRYQMRQGKVVQTIFGPRWLAEIRSVSGDGSAHYKWYVGEKSKAADFMKSLNS